jgi:acetyl-CoA acetyltransferase
VADIAVVGIGITKFGRREAATIRDMASEAAKLALSDAGITEKDVDFAIVGNALGGLITGQEAVRARVALQDVTLPGVPVCNVENACATSSYALHLAWLALKSGEYRCALVVGVEKMSSPDKQQVVKALRSAADMENIEYEGNFFMSLYAKRARAYMERTGARVEHFAKVAVKNRLHASLNPVAQYVNPVSVEDVLEAPQIVPPLTRLMCSPTTDGAAALVLMSRPNGIVTQRPVWFKASVAVSGGMQQHIAKFASGKAYNQSGIGPEDLDVVELHDGAAPAELELYEELGISGSQSGWEFLEQGHTALGGRVPVNTSGGLLSRGHPVGATGAAQVAEIVIQLRGDAGSRQVNNAKVGLAENAGGYVAGDTAVGTIHILAK